MKQSRRMSFVEACANVAIGYGTAVAANVVVLPLFGFHPSVAESAAIGLVFTAISLARSYVVRRLFEGLRPVHVLVEPPLFVTLRSPRKDEAELVIGKGGHTAEVYPVARQTVEKLAVEAAKVAWGWPR